MSKQRNDVKKAAAAYSGEFGFERAIDASPAETAEYLAQMASELITLAKTARLERLSLLLDFVRREAEAEAAA